MDNFNQLKDLISKSSVPFSDQIDLIALFSKAEDAELFDIVVLFSKDSLWISRLNDNYKQKSKALSTGDSNIWKSIIEEEKKVLEEIERENILI